MGLLTTQLEQQVLEAARRHGAVVWYDPSAAFSAWVDTAADRYTANEFRYPVVRFRGSYLQLLTDLAEPTKGIDTMPLLVHLVGLTADSVRPTPAAAIAKAGYPFTLDLPGLVQQAAAGRVEPQRIAAKLAEPGLTLAAADAWLEQEVSARRTGLEAELDRMPLSRLAEELLDGGQRLLGYPVDASVTSIVRSHVCRALGLSDAWRAWCERPGSAGPTVDVQEHEVELTFAWAMAVEYVHDLRREPKMAELRPLRDVAPALVANCKLVVSHVREKRPERYERMAIELEQRLGTERVGGRPQDLGDIDTFRFEVELLLRCAIDELTAGRWQEPRRWCEDRVVQRSFWLRRNPRIGAAWDLVNAASALLEVIATADPGLAHCTTPDDAMAAYAAELWRVDSAHRRLLQRSASLLEPQLPNYTQLRTALQTTRKTWRDWADRLARAFSAICRKAGYLPQADLQQRNLFDGVVRPLAQQGHTALFVVDALRFEMAHELLADLGEHGGTTQLHARLCELPSITAVGMNVLAPVATDGALQPGFALGKFSGFKAGEFTVRDIETRQRAMFQRVGGHRVPVLKLDEACDLTPRSLQQRMRGAQLTLVHSREIDDAGEAGLGVSHFDDVLRRLKMACRNLQSAGIRRFVFTADHGFLLQDDTAAVYRYGRSIDPERRHVWSADGHEQAGLVTVPAAALRYDGVSGAFLMPEDTGVFDRGAGQRGNFVHGGNSLQERVIPVLVADLPGGEIAEVACLVEASVLPPVMGMHVVKLRLRHATARVQSLVLYGEVRVELLIQVPDNQHVRTEFKAVRPEERFDGLRLRLPISEDWTEVFFALTGPADARVPLEIIGSDATYEVQSLALEGLFDVAGSSVATASPSLSGDAWLERIPDGGQRKVARQLSQLGVVTEEDLHGLLGSQRAARLFALQFDSFKALLPFGVQITMTDNGKAYRKD